MIQPTSPRPGVVIALAGAASVCILPALVATHTLPIPSFYEEWLAALLALVACAAVLWLARDGALRLPATALPMAAFGAILLLQVALGLPAYAGQGVLAILYVLFAIAMIWCGAELRGRIGWEQSARAIAGALLAAGALSAATGLLQAYGPGLADARFIAPLENARVSGNLAQSNLFASQLAVAGVSLLYLWANGTVRGRSALVLGALLLTGLSLSGSRSVWLYGGGLIAWAIFNRVRSANRRFGHIGIALGLSLALLVLAPWLLPPVDFAAGPATPNSAFERLAAMRLDAEGDGLAGLRGHFWRQAWEVAQHAPILGAGIGQFAFSFLQWAPAGDELGAYRVERNAHNIVLHLLAETGVAGLLCIGAAIGLWFVRILRTPADLTRWWIVASVGIVLLHSLLEYPLWYAHFLAPFALLIGLGETAHRPVRAQGAARIVAIGLLLAGATMLASLLHGYQELRRWVHQATDVQIHDPAFAARQREAIRRLRHGLLAPYVELPLAGTLRVDPENLQEKLALNERSMRFAPIAPIVLRQVVFLTLAGRHDEARRLLDIAARFYPDELPAFAADLDRLSARGLAIDDLATYLSARTGNN